MPATRPRLDRFRPRCYHLAELPGNSPMRDLFASTSCLVTGGAGFIGSNLCRSLVAAGAAVTVIDNFATGDRLHLPDSPLLTVVEADLVTMPDLDQRLSGCDFVFHLAAQVGNVKSIRDAPRDAETNILGTVRLLDGCRRCGVRKVVYSSSSAIFGEAQALPIDEEHRRNPASFYALSKLTGERYSLLAHHLWKVPTVCLRYFNVYGLPMENNEYTGVISIFFHRLAAGKPLAIFGDGLQSRDFVYVEDVVQANLLAAARAAGGEVFNVGTGTTTTVLGLAETMMAVTGRRVEVELRPPREGEVRHSVADIGRSRREIGYAPAVDLENGLRAMWDRLAPTLSDG